MVSRRAPPLAAAANAGPHPVLARRVLPKHLRPPRAGEDIEYSDIAAREQRKGLRDLALVVKLRTARGPERLEPSRQYEVRDQRGADPVAEPIRLAGVADLIGIQPPSLHIRLYEHRQIDLRIDQHLQQLVAGGHSPLQAELLIGAGKDLAQWQSLISDIMITQGPRRIRIIEDHEPPRPCWRGGAGRDED